MLTDSDKIDIFNFMTNANDDTENDDYTRLDLVSRAAARTMRFLIDHPDMCAAEFDDFVLDKKYALQEYHRLIEKND